MSLRFIHVIACDKISFVRLSNIPLYVYTTLVYLLIHLWTFCLSAPSLRCLIKKKILTQLLKMFPKLPIKHSCHKALLYNIYSAAVDNSFSFFLQWFDDSNLGHVYTKEIHIITCTTASLTFKFTSGWEGGQQY